MVNAHRYGWLKIFDDLSLFFFKTRWTELTIAMSIFVLQISRTQSPSSSPYFCTWKTFTISLSLSLYLNLYFQPNSINVNLILNHRIFVYLQSIYFHCQCSSSNNCTNGKNNFLVDSDQDTTRAKHNKKKIDYNGGPFDFNRSHNSIETRRNDNIWQYPAVKPNTEDRHWEREREKVLVDVKVCKWRTTNQTKTKITTSTH